MNDPVFLDSAAFLRVWQRVTGEAGITARPRSRSRTHSQRSCASVYAQRAAGAAFYAALAQRVCAVRPAARTDRSAGARAAQGAANRVFSAHGTLCALPAACPRLSTAAADLRCAYLQELALSAQLDAAADAVPMPLRETLRTHGAAGCAPRAARAHAAHPVDFLNKYTQNANLSNWYLTLREILIIMCKLTI